MKVRFWTLDGGIAGSIRLKMGFDWTGGKIRLSESGCESVVRSK